MSTRSSLHNFSQSSFVQDILQSTAFTGTGSRISSLFSRALTSRFKMEKNQLRNLRSQLRLEHLDRAFSRKSLEQLTLSPSGSRSFSSYLFKGELPQQSALRMTRTVQRRALEPLLFKSFQLTSAALLSATLVALSLVALQAQELSASNAAALPWLG